MILIAGSVAEFESRLPEMVASSFEIHRFDVSRKTANFLAD